MEEFRDYRNVHEMLKETVERHSEDGAYQWFVADGQTVSVTWREFYDQVRQVAKSLIALGIEKNDKVNILSYSSYRWVLTDMALMSVGAVTVGIYQSLPEADCQYIISHSDSVLVFVEDDVQLQKMLDIRADIPAVGRIVLLNGRAPENDWIISYEDFLALGADGSDADCDRMIAAVAPQDTAGIVYTSGTTGVPKGAVLTHDNITFTAQSVEKSVYWEPGDHVFLFLPLAHVFARTCVYTSLLVGSTCTFNRSMDTLADDLRAARPHWFPSVPRIYEKVYAKVLSGAEAKGGLALKIFRWACRVGEQVSDCRLGDRPIPPLTQLQYRLATRLVFSKIQAALGGRLRWCISGAAPLNPEIAKFFHSAGILILEGIGMTENTSFTNLNRYDDYRFGWVGPPGPGIEQRLGDDGEIMFRGRNVMKEYYKMPEETTATITAAGWQYSGDLGEIDDRNFLRVTGRKKELIITSGGKNIAPAAIEGLIATSLFISQVCVIGDRRKYLSALVSLDLDNVRDYAHTRGIAFDRPEDLMNDDAVQGLIDAEVQSKCAGLPSFETIKRVTIVPEFTIENGLLTPTMKLKKGLVIDRYQDIITAMYPDD